MLDRGSQSRGNRANEKGELKEQTATEIMWGKNGKPARWCPH